MPVTQPLSTTQRQAIDEMLAANYGNHLAGSYYAMMARQGVSAMEATKRLRDGEGRYHRSAICEWRNGRASIPRKFKSGMQRQMLGRLFDDEDVERIMALLDIDYQSRG